MADDNFDTENAIFKVTFRITNDAELVEKLLEDGCKLVKETANG